MKRAWRAVGVATVLATAGFGMSGCDGDDPDTDAGASVDSGPPPVTDAGVDAGAEVGPAHCLHVDIIIAEIDPGTSITIFNPTSDTIAIDDFNHVLCRRPSYFPLKDIEAGVVIAPGASHVFAWPGGSFGDDDDAGGEVALYNFNSFTSPTAQIDFVCWGPGLASGRKDVAEMDGDWSGDCAPPITGGSLRRVPGSDGTSAASYDPSGAAAALTCP